MITPDKVLSGVDIQAVKGLVRGTWMGKYGVSLRHGAIEAIGWAREFGLDDGEQRHILDIGCGSGLFCRTCNLLGHTAVGLDQPGYMHAKLAEQMGIQYDEHLVTTADPLPEYKRESFNTVTMMHVSNHEGPNLYKSLSDAVWRALAPGGQWWIVFHFVTQRWAQSGLWAAWFDPGTISQQGSRVLLLEKPK